MARTVSAKAWKEDAAACEMSGIASAMRPAKMGWAAAQQGSRHLLFRIEGVIHTSSGA